MCGTHKAQRPDLKTTTAAVALLAITAFIFAGIPISHANHGSGDYRQEIVTSEFYLPTNEVQKVLIVPPAYGQVYNENGVLNGGDTDELQPFGNTHLRAVEDSIQMWRDAVEEFGSDWFADGFGIEHYVLGRDAVPGDVLADADVIINMEPYKGNTLGLAFRGLMIPDQACTIHNSQFGLVPYSFTYEDMHHVNAHEFGHCLGLRHTVHPEPDLLHATYPHSIGSAGNPITCVSNLNVAGVQLAFAPLFEQPGGIEATVPVDQYNDSWCS